MKIAIIALAALVAITRPVLLFVELGPHASASYQALAHLLVGGLVGAWLGHRGTGASQRSPASHRARRWLLNWAIILTLVEVACAGITIARKLL